MGLSQFIKLAPYSQKKHRNKKLLPSHKTFSWIITTPLEDSEFDFSSCLNLEVESISNRVKSCNGSCYHHVANGYCQRCRQPRRLASSYKTSTFHSATVSSRLVTSLAGRVRCDARDIGTEVREVVDRTTQKTITEEDILRNQETNESEKKSKSVLGTEPTSGSLYPRPEVERRPETGDKSLTSLFAFDGAAPETINGRLVR